MLPRDYKKYKYRQNQLKKVIGMQYEKPTIKFIQQLLNLGYDGKPKDWFEIQVWLWEKHKIYLQHSSYAKKISVSIICESKDGFSWIEESFNGFDSPVSAQIHGVKECVKYLVKNKA